MSDLNLLAQRLTSQYLQGLAEADIQAILSLFSAEAIVKSPLYGELPATVFYPKLFADTHESVVELKDILTNESALSVCIFFTYSWTMANGRLVVFEVIDYLKLNEQGQIEFLQIIYDTEQARAAFEAIAG